MLFVAQTLQRNLGKNISLKFNRIDDLIFMHLEKTNITNVDELLKELKIVGITMISTGKYGYTYLNRKIFPGMPLDLTFEHISKIINKKPTDEENEIRELLLCSYINGRYTAYIGGTGRHTENIAKSLTDTFKKDHELVEYVIALKDSINNKKCSASNSNAL